MSASQARLLSITSRLTDNELQSQLLTQAKLRLATKSKSISDEYMDALSKTSLKMAAYDSTGAQTLIMPTANYLFTYEELKNQYGLVDGSGNFLASQSMIDAYEKSNTLAEFLANNGITSVLDNEIANSIDSEFTMIDENQNEVRILEEIFNLQGDTRSVNPLLTQEDFNKYTAHMREAIETNSAGRNITDIDVRSFIETIEELSSINYAKNIRLSDFTDAIPTLERQQDSYNGRLTNDPTWQPRMLVQIENILAPIVWGLAEPDGDNDKKLTSYVATPVAGTQFGDTTESAKYTLQEITLTAPSGQSAGAFKYNSQPITENVNASQLIDMFKDYGDIDSIAEMKEKLVSLYCQAVYYMNVNTTRMVNGNETAYGYASIPDENNNPIISVDSEDICAEGSLTPLEVNFNQMVNDYKIKSIDNTKLIKDFNSSLGNIGSSVFEKFYSNNILSSTFKNILINYQNERNAMEMKLLNWYESYEAAKLQLDKIKKDPRQQWFENLWYRMGATSENAKGEPTYKKLDSQYLNNSEWLEYALTHGIVSLEQAKATNKPSELYKGLLTTDWVSVQYGATQDIREVTDDSLVARAEAKYQKEMNELQAKDKDYDIKIKNLETQRSAMQTEYDQIKQLITKNIERSYKTFGNG